jgi:hypothetical protein
MPLVHKHCGGFVSSITCKCNKCGKKWNPLNFWFNPTISWNEIQNKRMSKEEIASRIASRHKKTQYASWADKLPGVGTVASMLPNWPRKVRIAVVLGLITAIVLLVVLL